MFKKQSVASVVVGWVFTIIVALLAINGVVSGIQDGSDAHDRLVQERAMEILAKRSLGAKVKDLAK